MSKTTDCLNEAFRRDPAAIHALLSNQMPCNLDLADDPFVLVGNIPGLEQTSVTALGLLNGVLTANGLGLVDTKWGDPEQSGRRPLLGFCDYPIQKEEE